MAQQEMFLEFHATSEVGLPQTATFRLESQMAVEVQATILTAAAMLCLDATAGSQVQAELDAVNAKIKASDTEIRKSWLDRQGELQAKVDAAMAWYTMPCSVVFVQGYHREPVWQGKLKELANVCYSIAKDRVKVRPSAELAKRVQDWPVPVPTNANAKEEPKSATTAVQASEDAITPADLPGASVAPESAPVQAADNGVEAAKAKAKAAKAGKAAYQSPEVAAIEKDAAAGKQVSVHELIKEMSLEQKVNALLKEGMSVTEARKKARTM